MPTQTVRVTSPDDFTVVIDSNLSATTQRFAVRRLGADVFAVRDDGKVVLGGAVTKSGGTLELRAPAGVGAAFTFGDGVNPPVLTIPRSGPVDLPGLVLKAVDALPTASVEGEIVILREPYGAAYVYSLCVSGDDGTGTLAWFSVPAL